MARSRMPGQHRHQLRALSSIARYLPVFIGVILSIPFTASVLRDDADTAMRAWRTGSELLGLYGGFFAVALPFTFFVTAYLRRGKARAVTGAKIRRDDVAIELPSGRTLMLPHARIKRGFATELPSGAVRVNLELEGGLTEGDRVILDLDPEDAEPLVKRFVGKAPHFDLSRTNLSVGLAMFALSAFLGTFIASTVLGAVVPEAQRFGATMAEIDGWRLGLLVAATGLVHAALSLLLAPKSVVVGVDGLRVESMFRRTFIAYESIDEIEVADSVVTIRHGHRATHVVALGVDDGVLESLARLAEERRGLARPATVSIKLREPPSIKRWREAILKNSGGTNYRERTISEDDLKRALSAPGVHRELRIAAAMTLAERGSAKDRTRIRVAAAAVADDRTRALLERIAEEDGAVVEAMGGGRESVG